VVIVLPAKERHLKAAECDGVSSVGGHLTAANNIPRNEARG